MGQIRHIPPETFDALYRFYKSNRRPPGFLWEIVCGRMYEAAKSADPTNHQYLADIVLFMHDHADRVPVTNELFDFKWESWRVRFSPDATEIQFNRGEED